MVRWGLWEFETGAKVWASPAIGLDGTVYIGSWDNKLYAINGKTGGKLWEFETGMRASPSIGFDGTVYVGSFAVNGKSGDKLWGSRDTWYAPPPPSDCVCWMGTTSSMPSGPTLMALRSPKRGPQHRPNVGKIWEFETGDSSGELLPSHRIGWHGVRRVMGQKALCHQWQDGGQNMGI